MGIEEYVIIILLMSIFFSTGYGLGSKNLADYKIKQMEHEKLDDLTIEECIVIMSLIEHELNKGNEVDTCETYLNIYNKLNKGSSYKD